jgi:23S rRNA (cytosine1962-C5)-methyltransferase
VTFLDSSTPALEAAADAAQRNGCHGRFECVAGNAGDVLRTYRDDGRKFGLIVLDPPKFVQSAAQIEKGCRAYKDVNRLAFEVLQPGGILATFSCSSHVESTLFQKVIAQAALEAGRDAQIIERLAQPADHPVALTFPESEYLCGLILRT